MTFWTAERTARLRALVAENLSANVIARRLSAEAGERISRNAVIGKVCREKLHLAGKPGPTGLARREIDPVPARLPSVRAAKAGAVADKAAPAALSASRAASQALPVGAPAGRRRSAELHSEPRPATVVPVNLPAPVSLSFWSAILHERCLHFVGDPFGPSGPDMPVCGAKRAAFAPADNRYCARHRLSVFQCRDVPAEGRGSDRSPALLRRPAGAAGREAPDARREANLHG